jgi:hypothetical protein
MWFLRCEAEVDSHDAAFGEVDDYESDDIACCN